jgi:hypothetical protein
MLLTNQECWNSLKTCELKLGLIAEVVQGGGDSGTFNGSTAATALF